jgi:very-short-patch-repair endonuclease
MTELTSARTRRLRRRAVELAAAQSGVLCRRQLRSAGIPRWLLQLEVRAGRWRRTGRQTVVVHNGPTSEQTRRAVAAMEVGRRAALDGVSALQHLGVTALTDRRVHVIAPRGSSPRRPRGVVVHESRRYREDDVVVVGGVRVVTAAVASVHAALWARTDREATYVLLLAVQQRLAEPAGLAEAVGAVRRHPRRRLLLRVAGEIAGGVRALGELDVARALRERGLPEPDRQVVRRRPWGTEYLDARFERYRLTLEIDGVQHDEIDQRVSDVLRDFALVADGDAVLRLPVAVFRLAREQVLDRLEQVLISRGWHRTVA